MATLVCLLINTKEQFWINPFVLRLEHTLLTKLRLFRSELVCSRTLTTLGGVKPQLLSRGDGPGHLWRVDTCCRLPLYTYLANWWQYTSNPMKRNTDNNGSAFIRCIDFVSYFKSKYAPFEDWSLSHHNFVLFSCTIKQPYLHFANFGSDMKYGIIILVERSL